MLVSIGKVYVISVSSLSLHKVSCVLGSVLLKYDLDPDLHQTTRIIS